MGRLIQFTKALSVIAALTVSLFAVRAEATVITWTLNNFVFDDTTTATGFFF